MSNKAQVTVVNNVVSVDIDKLRPDDAPTTLEWKLKTPGWSFTATGIVIDNVSVQFSNPTRKNNGNTFTWDDANSDGLTYKYTIWVQQGSNAPIGLDPLITNKKPPL